jgi:hypothetical protein
MNATLSCTLPIAVSSLAGQRAGLWQPRSDGQAAIDDVLHDERRGEALRGHGLAHAGDAALEVGHGVAILLLYFAILPQFVRAQAPLSPPLQLAVLAAIHIATCIVVYLAVAAAAHRLLAARPRASEVVARASGLAMIAVAATLPAGRVPAT